MADNNINNNKTSVEISNVSQPADNNVLQQPKPKKNHTSLKIILAVILIIIAAIAAYCIVMQAKLDAQVNDKNYDKAIEISQYMPWLKLTDNNLYNYLQGVNKINNGNIDEGLALLKPLGGYLDSEEIYANGATIEQIIKYSSSENPLELLAALEKLPQFNTAGKYDDIQALLYAQSYKIAVSLIQSSPSYSVSLLEALPAGYNSELKTNLEIAKIINTFQTDNRSTIYEDTYEAMKPYVSTEQGGTFLLSSSFISMFMNGTWKTADGGYYYTQTTNNFTTGDGTHKTNLPKEKKNIAAEYDDACLYVQREGENDYILMYTFKCIDYNTIELYNCYDGVTYTMYRK